MFRWYWQRIARRAAWHDDSWVDVVLGDVAWGLLLFGILVCVGQGVRFVITNN